MTTMKILSVGCKRKVLLLALLVSACLPFATAAAASRGIELVPVEKKPETPFVAGQYRALVVGNNNYRDPKGHWPSLKTAVTDARAVAGLLKNAYGFSDVVLLENATRREILHALSGLGRRVMRNDSVLVYYAGHGFLDAETRKGYWVPVDAEGVDQATFLRNSTIRDELSLIASRGRHTLLISDSCFSGTLLRSGTRGVAPEAEGERYFEKVAQKKSVQIITAGGAEFVDDDYQTSGHSPFTYFLLNELKHNDRPLLTASELSTNVQRAVANNVSQVPESGVLQGAGDELGEFIFINVDVDVKGIPKDKVKVKVNIVSDEKPAKVETPPAPPAHKPSEPRLVFPVPTI
jgi:uncharacterized caspase-like protein